MYPPVPIGLPCLVPTEGAEVCGMWVPGGVSSLFFLFLLHKVLGPFKLLMCGKCAVLT